VNGQWSMVNGFFGWFYLMGTCKEGVFGRCGGVAEGV
jgi:hypothetical protein